MKVKMFMRKAVACFGSLPMLVAFFLILAWGASAQDVLRQRGTCGFVPTQESIERVQALKAELDRLGWAAYRSGDVVYVPLKIHLAGTSNGTGYRSEAAILDMVCELNEQYADQNIQFYIYQGFNYIANNTVNNNPGNASLIMNGNKVNNALNIFVCQSADSGGIGETLGYYSNQYDWIVMKKTEANGYSNTLPHEVGHYFSLLHPFNGWDCTWWQESIHGNPVSSTIAPCPSGAPPFGSIQVEYVDGSNCNTAGDLLCDTPADYNLGFADNDDCNYTGNCMDPHGDVLQPMEDNMMSYFGGCPDYEFTPMQKSLIAANLASRSYLQTNYTPPATEITFTSLDVNTPLDGSTTDYYNVVLFDWEDIPGANHYLLEVDILPSFNLSPVRKISDWSGAFIYDLQPNTTYYYRVKPFNEYYTCAGFSSVYSFQTSSTVGVQSLDFVRDVQLSPNPVEQGGKMFLSLQSDHSFEARLELWSLRGERLWVRDEKFSLGANVLSLPTEDLAAGLYLAVIQSDEGLISKKFVVR